MAESINLKPTALDLFCGCGGLTQGLKKAGFNVLGAVDVDPLSVQTYKDNHKKTYVWLSDIRSLKVADVKKRLGLKKGSLDLLAGCPPCQGFSTLRTLNGSCSVDDPRNDLLFEFLRFVKALRPKTVMLENVPGLAADVRFQAFLATMNELGYLGDHRVLNAADYGVPQRRRRLIYLAGYNHTIPFAEPVSMRKTVRDVIGSLPKAGESGDPAHDVPEKRTTRIINLISRIPKDGGSRTDLPKKEQLDCHKRCNGFKDVYGRMAWKDVAPTITSGCFNPSKGRFLHPEENRAITLREAALLQGFPPKYKFPVSAGKSSVALLIGNALPPPFITAHAKAIKEIILSKFSQVKELC